MHSLYANITCIFSFISIELSKYACNVLTISMYMYIYACKKSLPLLVLGHSNETYSILQGCSCFFGVEARGGPSSLTHVMSLSAIKGTYSKTFMSNYFVCDAVLAKINKTTQLLYHILYTVAL